MFDRIIVFLMESRLLIRLQELPKSIFILKSHQINSERRGIKIVEKDILSRIRDIVKTQLQNYSIRNYKTLHL